MSHEDRVQFLEFRIVFFRLFFAGLLFWLLLLLVAPIFGSWYFFCYTYFFEKPILSRLKIFCLLLLPLWLLPLFWIFFLLITPTFSPPTFLGLPTFGHIYFWPHLLFVTPIFGLFMAPSTFLDPPTFDHAYFLAPPTFW